LRERRDGDNVEKSAELAEHSVGQGNWGSEPAYRSRQRTRAVIVTLIPS
jgi:hypothetical protein